MNVRVTCGLPEVVVTVITPTRVLVDALDPADTVIEPSPEPDDGDTVNQFESDTACHDVFDDTAIVTEPAVAPRDHPDGNDNDGFTPAAPGCVTVIGTLTCGLPLVVVNVTVAMRALVDALTSACNDKVPLPEPDVGDTCNHD